MTTRVDNAPTARHLTTVPADMVEALRAGLYIELSAATDALSRTKVPAGQKPDPDRYKRLDATRALMNLVGYEPSATPTAIQVDLDEHHLPLLAGLHGKLEAEARLLGNAQGANGRDAGQRLAMVVRLGALSEFITAVEAQGGARPSEAAGASTAASV